MNFPREDLKIVDKCSGWKGPTIAFQERNIFIWPSFLKARGTIPLLKEDDTIPWTHTLMTSLATLISLFPMIAFACTLCGSIEASQKGHVKLSQLHYQPIVPKVEFFLSMLCNLAEEMTKLQNPTSLSNSTLMRFSLVCLPILLKSVHHIFYGLCVIAHCATAW